MSLLDELSEATGRVAAEVGGSLVRIGRDGGRGAGVVIGTGLVLTSAHNLRGGEVTVTFADGRSVVGEVKGVDSDGDLAVVAADTASVTPITWSPGDTGELHVGQVIFALGTLPSSGGTRVTFGTVSALGSAFRGPRGRLISDGFEHTATVGRGSSGGPVVDAGGRLVGINTHRPGDGLYLALPATTALKDRVDSLGRGENPSRRRLGVALVPPHVARRMRAAVGLAAHDGVLIRDVAEGGPAATAGLQRGDLIVSIDGHEVASIDDLLGAIDAAGEAVSVAVLRGSEQITVDVRFDG